MLEGRIPFRGFHTWYREEGSTTTPFDMVVLNKISRYHLAIEALKRARRKPKNAQALIDECEATLARHDKYIEEHLDDMPEVRDWTWTPAS